jgi:hypothetical protein
MTLRFILGETTNSKAIFSLNWMANKYRLMAEMAKETKLCKTSHPKKVKVLMRTQRLF